MRNIVPRRGYGERRVRQYDMRKSSYLFDRSPKPSRREPVWSAHLEVVRCKSFRNVSSKNVGPGFTPGQRVVSAAFCLALGDEITMLQQLHSVLLQKPLDRSRTRLMWSHVDVADPLSHSGSSRVLPRKGERDHIC
jgi:hypothetical protein